MKRKLVQHGEKTLMVSVPAKWVRARRLKKGDEVEIVEEENRIIIGPKKGSVALKKDVFMPTPKDCLKRLIDIPYVQGYDEITVHFEDAKVMEFLQVVTERLLGMEIVKQTESTCTIKNVAEALEKEFDTILRRLFLLIKTMGEDGYKFTKERDFKKLANVGDLERMSQKYSMFCMRMLSKYGYKSEKEVHAVYYTAYMLEQLSDFYAGICNHIAERKLKLAPTTLNFFKDIVTLTSMYYNLFYKRDIEKIIELKKQLRKANQKAESALELKKDVYIIHHLNNIREKIDHLTHLIA